MKYIGCFLFICIFCLQSNAQKVKDKQLLIDNGFIDVQAGLAIPVSDFADKNFKRASGYANLGYAVKLGIRYDIAPLLGLGLHYQYFQNGFDESRYLADLKNNFNDVTFNSFASKPWTLQGVMFGVYVPFKSYRTSVDVGFSGGVFSGNYPDNTVYYTTSSQPVSNWTANQYGSNASNFALQTGVKMRYQIYRNILLSISADFTYCEIEFKDIQETRTNGTTTQSFSLNPYTQYYHILQLAAGIGIQVK